MRHNKTQRDAKILHTAPLEQLSGEEAASQGRADTGKDRGITEAGAGAADGSAEIAAHDAGGSGETRAGGAGDEREIQALAARKARPSRQGRLGDR
jgi:hypothetical protein